MTKDNALARWQAGEEDAFAEVVKLQQDLVWSVCWNALRDREAAREIGQEVFWELYQRRAAIQSEEHLVRWLRTVASRRCIDQLRRRQRRPTVDLAQADHAAAIPSNGDPLLRRALLRLLNKLSPKARLVLVLRYQEDLEPAEIAATLGESVHTVKSRLQRSLRWMKNRLRRQEGPPDEHGR